MVPVHQFLSSARRGAVSAAVALTMTLVALPASPRAQDPNTPAASIPDQQPDFSQDAPAHLAVIDGVVTLERDGRVATAEENVPLLAGDRLRTDDGRVEVLFADGSVLDIDKYSTLDLLSDSLVRVRAGRIRLSIARVTESLEYRIDAAGTSTLIRTAGEYRLSVSDARSTDPTVDLAVVRGTAELSSPLGRTLVRPGTRASASEHTEPSLATPFNSTESTDFDRWAEEQRDARLGVESSRYLPSELGVYGGALDANGNWGYEPSYGYVWYPRVEPTWRPYYYGGWSVVGSFGWVWVGGGSWCWPTHHYGRWNVVSGRWFWTPGRYWGPGWVSWAVSPGYVSWCPLGYNGRPAVTLSAPGRYGHAWTVVPAQTFNTRAGVIRNARAVAVQPTSLSTFSRSAAPRSAIRAGAQPLRSPSGVRTGSASGVRAGVTPRDLGAVRPGESLRVDSPRTDSPRAVPRSTSTWPPPRDARTPAQPSTPTTPSSEPRRAGVRSVMPPNVDIPDRTTPTSRSPGDAGRVRSGSVPSRSYTPPPDPTPSSPRAMSRRVMPPSTTATNPPPAAGSSGWRRVAPPDPGPRSGGGESRPPDPPRSGMRAVPRSAPSTPPPSASAPQSRGRGQSAPPPSSSSGSGSSTGRAGRRGGR